MVTTSKRFFKFAPNSWISGGVDYHYRWDGAAVEAEWLSQARKALQRSLELAVTMAKQFAPNPSDPGSYPYSEGDLQESIRARRLTLDKSAGVLSGVFGSFTVRYAIWQEIGYNRNGRFIQGRHFIRRAGDIAMAAFPGYFNAFGGGGGGGTP